MKITRRKKAILARSKNPFNTGSPARGKDFFGRKDIIDSINTYLQNPQEYNFLIYGQRRIGKTSLLRKIQEGTNIPILEKSVYFNLQDKARIALNQLIFELADRMNKDLDLNLGVNKANFTPGGARQFFKTQFLPKVFEELSENEVLIFLFDEFDVLGKIEDIEGDPSITIFSYHQFIPYIVEIIEEIQVKKYPIKFIFAIGRNYKDLKQERFGQITKFGKQRELDLFSEEETERLLRKLSDNILPFESDAIKKVHNLTSGHPYFTQCLASSAFEFAEKFGKKEISQDIIEQQLIASIKNYSGGVYWIWASLPPKDKVILFLMATIREEGKPIDVKGIRDKALSLNFGPVIDELSEVLKRLQNHKFIAECNNKGEYKFYVEYIRKWIVLENSVEEIEGLFNLIDEEINLFLHNARYYFNRKNYEQAREYYSQILEKLPYHFEALLFLGKCFKNLIKKDRQNMDRAIKWFEQAYPLNPFKIKDEYLELLYMKLEWINERKEDPEKILVDIHKIESSDAKITGELVGIYIVKDKDISEIANFLDVEELNLKDKQLIELPKQIVKLKNLKKLDLSNNKIVSDIADLKDLHLISLDLRNNQITHLPHEIVDMGMDIRWEGYSGIILENNPLESPPIAIVKKGRDVIINYFKSLEAEKHVLNEVKVILVGDGGVGKTSLVKRLLGEEFDKHEPQTHGINIRDWKVEDIHVHFWDFGGQEIMHATHQFFLSKRSLYILVLDGRRDEKTEYWLKHIESFGGDSPILVVLNKIDENPGFDMNRKFLQKKYKGIIGFYRVSCAKSEGIDVFTDALSKALADVELIETTWPKTWFNVKTQLEDMTENFISIDEYKEMCTNEKITEKTDQDTLVDFLNDLGVILHFKDFELLDTHVLEPKWVTTAVYKIINSDKLAECNGVLKLDMLGEILKNEEEDNYYYPSGKYRYIVDLMKKFELCYEIDKETVLLPDLLEVQEPVFDFDYDAALKFVIDYDFLPRSVMPRFIVKMHRDIASELRWRTGVVLEDKASQSSAVIKVDELAEKIYIYVDGEQKRDYFSILRKTLQDINASFEKLEVRELVPLPDNDEIAIEYDELIGYEQMGIEDYTVGKLRKIYSVKEILDGIEKEEERIMKRGIRSENKYQVALSFAGEDRIHAQKLAELLKERDISVFYDSYEQAYLWGKDLYQHFQSVYRDRAQYCVVFLSQAYAQMFWTRQEHKYAQSRAFQENKEYILPIRIDDTEIPGINETIGYIDLRSTTMEEIVDLLVKKLSS